MEFACVLKSGGQYGVEHVARLRQHLPSGRELVCLTDMPKADAIDGVRVVPLVNGWPGWWSKIELFRPDVFSGPVLYLDLDVVVHADPTPLLRHDFTMCVDFIKPELRNSSVMSWGVDMPHVYQTFKGDPKGLQRRFKSWPSIGDQAFIQSVTDPATFPAGDVVSWRLDCADGIPDGAKVVAFHGKPKPWEVGR